MEMPSLEEQKIAEDYVLRRPLTRPDTDAKKAAKYCILYFVVSFALGVALLLLFDRLGIFSVISSIENFKNEHPFIFKLLFILSIYLLTGICCAKKAAIGCIKMYQHYASEKTRRSCLFKPTCSEYGIMAINKYGLLIGLVKIFIRLFIKCGGNVYRIDYP